MVPVLTILLLVCRFDIHSVEREARFSRNGEVSDAKSVHLLLSLAPGAALLRATHTRMQTVRSPVLLAPI